MTGWSLELRQAPALRVDLRGVTPAVLAGLSIAEVERMPIGHGNALIPLAELFTVQAEPDADLLTLAGDLSRVDRIGWRLAAGRIVVDGPAGHYAGACMTGGTLDVRGHAGLLAGCEMAGGRLDIAGDADDFAAASLPGSMDGMRGGTLVVRGDVGQRFGDRMRRGTAVVFGRAGDFLASRMVAGSIAIGGGAGAHVGYGMRRGSLVFATHPPAIPPTFVPAGADAPVFWQLLARNLATLGGPFDGLARRSIARHLGDLSFDGKGELILVD